jgi:hypothetical protein
MRPISRCEDLSEKRKRADKPGIDSTDLAGPYRAATEVKERSFNQKNSNQLPITEERWIMCIYKKQLSMEVKRFGSALVTRGVAVGVLVLVVTGSMDVSLAQQSSTTEQSATSMP